MENIKKSRLILALRNSFNIKPIQVLLPKDKESYSISDAFCWRSDKNFITVFRYTDLVEYFTNVKNLNIKLVICDHSNNIISSTVFKIKDLTSKVTINKIIKKSKKKSDHFFIFHELSPQIAKKVLRNSCYTSYTFQNNIQSLVHGNLPVLAENQNFHPYNKNIIQVSHFKTYDYMVQNNFVRYDKQSFFL